MHFPTREADIIRLLLDVANGLDANKDVFPVPPTSADALRKAADDFVKAHDGAVADAGRSVQSTAIKEAKLKTAMDLTKAVLRYGESVTKDDPSKLSLIAWAPHRPRTPQVLALPGQVSTLQVVSEHVTEIALGWQEPFDGGAVAAYKVQRRKRADGVWTDVGTAVDPTITLTGQDAGVEWEYRVIAVNKTGQGPESNVVRAVL